MRVRVATLDDAEAIRLIYNHAVETSTATFDLVPRTLEDQQAWQHQRTGAHVVLVAEEHARVVGFGALSPYKERPAYRMTVEDSVYVHPDALRRGVGRLVLSELVDTARRHGFHSVIARIEASQVASLALHAAVGFELVGTEREVGRKFGRWLSVSTMQRLLTDPPPPGRFRPPSAPGSPAGAR